MASLIITGLNISYQLPRLATCKPLHSISEKTITIAVRKALRKLFKNSHIEVSCDVNLNAAGCWNGYCIIKGQRYVYVVQ